MGHNIGISASYYKPTEKEVLEDYLKAVDLLTIDSDKQKLLKQVEELKGKNKDDEFIIKGKMQEKDEQIEELRSRQDKFEQLIQSLIATGQFKPKCNSGFIPRG